MTRHGGYFSGVQAALRKNQPVERAQVDTDLGAIRSGQRKRKATLGTNYLVSARKEVLGAVHPDERTQRAALEEPGERVKFWLRITLGYEEASWQVIRWPWTPVDADETMSMSAARSRVRGGIVCHILFHIPLHVARSVEWCVEDVECPLPPFVSRSSPSLFMYSTSVLA